MRAFSQPFTVNKSCCKPLASLQYLEQVANRKFYMGLLAQQINFSFFYYTLKCSRHIQKQPPKVLCKKSVFKNFAIPTEFTCVGVCSGLKTCNFIEKRLQHKNSCEYCEIFKKIYFEEHLGKATSTRLMKKSLLISAANKVLTSTQLTVFTYQ